jgi:hypothetical protein
MGLPKPEFEAAEYRRHPRHAHPTIRVDLDGQSYATVDWSKGGFLIAAYDGACRPGDHALVDLVIPGASRRFTTEIVVARISRDDRLLAARFTSLAPDAAKALAGLVALTLTADNARR